MRTQGTNYLWIQNKSDIALGLSTNLKKPLSSSVLCEHAEILNCLQIKLGLSGNNGSTLQYSNGPKFSTLIEVFYQCGSVSICRIYSFQTVWNCRSPQGTLCDNGSLIEKYSYYKERGLTQSELEALLLLMKSAVAAVIDFVH